MIILQPLDRLMNHFIHPYVGELTIKCVLMLVIEGVEHNISELVGICLSDHCLFGLDDSKEASHLHAIVSIDCLLC